ncbi:MAG: hypothetical protein ACK5H1_01575 [Tenacibaculum sp.]
MLSYYQANNTGNNVDSQPKTLTIEDLLEQFERNDEKQDWLAIQQLDASAQISNQFGSINQVY